MFIGFKQTCRMFSRRISVGYTVFHIFETFFSRREPWSWYVRNTPRLSVILWRWICRIFRFHWPAAATFWLRAVLATRFCFVELEKPQTSTFLMKSLWTPPLHIRLPQSSSTNPWPNCVAVLVCQPSPQRQKDVGNVPHPVSKVSCLP
jgi:hypothetical protein